MYAFSGEIRRDVRELSRDVHCLRASLSEQDFERVVGLSARPFRWSISNSCNWLVNIAYLASFVQYLIGRKIHGQAI